MYSVSSTTPISVKSLSFSACRCGARSSSSMLVPFVPRCRLPSADAAHYIQSQSRMLARAPSGKFAMLAPLMPKATAVWLVENTSLTFEQIADFCGLHPLAVQAIADGEVATQMQGLDPVANGQTTAEEIARCQADPNAR